MATENGNLSFTEEQAKLADTNNETTVETKAKTPNNSATDSDIPETYTVVKGDTFASIGAMFGLAPGSIISLNEIEDPNALKVGTELKIRKTNN